MPSRQQMWEQLPAEVDLLVVGGGIVGAGVARDAALRGLRTLLVEKDDLAYGTSSRSSKLVHGGLRYLQQFRIGLVFESVGERRVLMRLAPHLVESLAFLFPVYAGSRERFSVIRAGLWLYDALALFRSPKRHRAIARSELGEVEPALNARTLKGAALYYDCATDDARLTLETALGAIDTGATVLTRAQVEDFLVERGRIVGAVIRNIRGGFLHEVRARIVVNATGPWSDLTASLGGREARPRLRPTKGIHIVVDRAKLPIRHAVVCFHPVDGRVLFAVPWGDRAYVGTTDTDYEGDLDELAATREDVQYLLQAVGSYFPAHRLTADDVIATWAGLRPLMAAPKGVHESQISREHWIEVGDDGLVTIGGGKLTTYRRMASDVVEAALRRLRSLGELPAGLGPAHSDRHPLPGAVGWPAEAGAEAVVERVLAAAEGRLSKPTALHLAGVYGMRAIPLAKLCVGEPSLAEPVVEGSNVILAQIRWAMQHELADSLSDVLLRRTQLFYRMYDQGLAIAPRVAEIMAAWLKWDESRLLDELQAYEQAVALSRRWRTG